MIDSSNADATESGPMPDLADQPSCRWWSVPVVWGIAAIGVAALIAATAPSSERPPERIATALVLAGATLSFFSWRGRHWRLFPFGIVSIVGGVLLRLDGPRFIEPVTRVGGIVVVIVGALASRWVLGRLGRLASAAAFSVFVAAATLFVYYDRELLSLALGVSGALAVVVAGTGLARARRDSELSAKHRFGEIMDRGARAIIERASDAAAGEPVRDKVLYTGAGWRSRVFRFVVLMSFASAIASLGVLADSTAVVIGAMLVAPLLTPFMGMSLSLVVGLTEELRRESFVALLGTAVAIGVGYLMSAMFGSGTDVASNAEIVSRTSPTLLDLVIALAAGAAGAYALSRRDVSDALPGVAVAIALVPPLAVVGITAQLGAADDAIGAFLLFGANAMAIIAMGALTFLVTGAAAAESKRRWTLDWWTIGLGAVAVVVFAALVINTAAVNEDAVTSERATAAIERWIGDRDYEVISVDVGGPVATIVLSGPSGPGDLDDLGSALALAVPDAESVDVRIAVTEQATLELDG
ncbi:DUF389 domain-containing protein [Ilumatobacter coccineus]|nr:DUF389 domain-containing protein [Ilumatobacter coccineus]